MKGLISRCLPLALALGLSAEATEPSLKITVQVYNYAAVSDEALARAEREAARIYGRIGLETEWLDCPLSPAEAVRYPACQLPQRPTTLVIRLLSRGMAERLRRGRMTFGFAMLPEDGGFGFTANVFSHRAEELAGESANGSNRAVILGHLMAHELGHLLLGVGSHSARGLMHVPWYRTELERVAQGQMLFTSRQAKKIRAQLHARIRAEAAAQQATLVAAE